MSTAKIQRIDEAAAVARAVRDAGGTVVMTNGCFDILHPGHVEMLGRAREAGDLLVVAVNSDASTRRLKGAGRPVFEQDERAEVLAALESVDVVCVFDEDTPLQTILAIRPDVLVKGADWKEKGIVGRAEVEGWGGRVVALELVQGQSTSGILERVLERRS